MIGRITGNTVLVPEHQWERIAAVVRAAAEVKLYDQNWLPTIAALAVLTPDDIEAVQP